MTMLKAAEAFNIIPDQVEMAGTVRTLMPLRDFAEKSAQGIARGFGGDVEVKYRRYDPVTFNHTEGPIWRSRRHAISWGAPSVDDKLKPRMGSEDFAYMLETRPGAIVLLGNGSTAGVAHPAFQRRSPANGIGYWVSLVEAVLAP